MRAVLQRVRSASVSVEGRIVGEIGPGIVVLLGFGGSDEPGMIGGSVWNRFMQKLLGLRLFPDGGGPINASLADHGGGILVVSQFTLYADTRKGNRPSFVEAARPEQAEPLYEDLVRRLRLALGDRRVGCGVFGAEMKVRLLNDGPVTIELRTD